MGVKQMSDNAIIILEKTEKGYEITHKDIDSDGENYSHYIRSTLKNAIKKCKQIQDEYQPEYYIYIKEI